MGVNDITINLRANVVNVQQALGTAKQAIDHATTSAQKFGPAAQTATAGFTKMQGAAVSGNKAINQFAVGSEQATGKLGKFGKIFSDNRGIVFGVAGLTSALAEAVGMMGMFSDTQLRLAEAQENLNKLEEQGVTSGKAHADAVAEVVKQQRFFNMVSRNTILSQMDMVFFTTMVISGLVKMNTEGGAAAGMLGKLKGMFTGLTGALSTTTNNFGSFMNTFSPLPTTLGKTQQAAVAATNGINQVGMTSALSATKVAAFAGALAGIGLAAYGIYELISAAEKLKAAMNETFSEAIMKISMFSGGILQLRVMLNIATEDEKKAFAELNAATEIQTKAMENLGFTGIKAFMLTDEEIQKLKDEIKRLALESDNTGKVLNESLTKALTPLESFNSTLQEMRDIQASINPHIADFQAMWNETKPPIADAGKLIKGFVAGLELAPPLAEELEDDLNAWVQGLAKSEKEAAKVLTKFEQIAESVKLVNAVIAINNTKPLMNNMDTFFGESFSQRLEKSKEKIRGFTSSAQLLFKQFQTAVAQDASLTAEEFLGAFDDLPPEIASIFMDLVNKSKDANKDIIEQFSNFESEAQNAYNEAAAAAQRWIDIHGLTTPVLQNVNSVLADTVVRIDEQANMIEDNATAWDRMTEATTRQTDANFDTIIAWAKTNDMLMSNLEWQFMVKDAQVQGMVAAKNQTREILLNAKAAETQRANFISLNESTLKNVATSFLLTDEIVGLTEALQRGTDATIALRREQDAAVQSSLDFFSSLTGAEDKKEFGKQWKDLDLGAVPKKLRDDFKGLFKVLRDIDEKGNEAATSLKMAIAAANFNQDKVSIKEAGEAAEKAFEVFKKSGADLTVWGGLLETSVLDPMLALTDKQLGEQLDKYPLTFDAISTAVEKGGVDLGEWTDILTKAATEGFVLKDLTAEQVTMLENLGFKYDSTTGKITKATEETKMFTEEMAKIEATAIVTETIRKMWAVMGEQIHETNGLINDSWVLIMEQILIATDIAETGIVTTFETDIPDSVQVSIDKVRELAAGLLSIATLMQEGAGGENGFKLQNIFNDKGPGDIPSQPPSAGGPSDPFNQKGFNQLRISEDEGKGGKGGLSGQWATMLDQMLLKLQTTIESMNAEFAKLVQYWADAITVMIESNQVLHENWAENTLFIAEETSILVVEIAKTWGTLISEVDDMNQALEQAWSENMANMAQNAADAGKGITQEFEKAMEAIIDKADDMLGEWQNAMDDMVQAAADAAEDIQNEMDSIKDTESIHTIRTVRVGQSQGGIWSMAEGGISAASGLYTTNGPANLGPFHFGDNSGGRETVAFLPHDGNKADRILDQLDGMFGRSKSMTLVGGGGERDIIVPITVNINGEQYSFTQRYRVRQGQDIANQVF